MIDAATDLDAFGETAKLSALNDRLGGKKASKIKELTAAVRRQKKRSAQSESQFDFSGDYVIRSSDDATDQIAICLRALEDQGKKHDPEVFIRPDNLPGRIGKGGVVSLPTPRALRPMLTDMVQYYAVYETRPPKREFIQSDLADHVFFSPQLEEVLPPLKKVVTIPIFDKDGNLRTKQGYLPSIATYVAPDIDVGEINGDNYEEAVAYVFNDVVPDFPFCESFDGEDDGLQILLEDVVDEETGEVLVKGTFDKDGRAMPKSREGQGFARPLPCHDAAAVRA